MASQLKDVNSDSSQVKIAYIASDTIQHFLENVTLLTPLQAGHALINELQKLNRQQMDARTRIRTIEQYQHQVAETTSELEAVYSNSKIPLSAESSAYAATVQTLWAEMLVSYKHALIDLKQSFLSAKSKTLNSLVIYRILEALKQQARTQYLCYASPDESFWSEVHKAFFHALQLNLEDAQPNINRVKKDPLHVVYKQILLLHLCGPQRLNKTAFIKTANLVNELAPFAQLRGIGDVINPTGLFVVNLALKHPPIAYKKYTQQPNIETDILLITVELARQLHQRIILSHQHKRATQQANDRYDETTLRHLMSCLGHPPTRQFNRIEKNHKVDVAFGFNSLHIQCRKNKRANSSNTNQWQVKNISPTGYALKNSDTSSQKEFTIGELIAIDDGQSSNCAIGQVAWAQVKQTAANDEHLEIGVRLISPSGKSVAFQAGERSEKAILLPGIKALNHAPSILVSRTPPEHAKHKIAVANEGQINQIKFKSCVHKTEHFQQFEYRLVDGTPT